MKTSIPPVLITFALVCFALVQNAQAVSPPPDGGYPGANTAEGQAALLSLTTGTYNTAVGIYSLLSDTTGRFNTGIGAATLLANTGDQNTGTGAGALLTDSTGSENTATGAFALFDNTTGSFNTANGVNALLDNTTGVNNTATGFAALGNTATGSFNTANGVNALLHNTTGVNNTVTGYQALLSNTTGDFNTAIGSGAMSNVTAGHLNVAIGAGSGVNIVSANEVVAIGNVEGVDVSFTTWIGGIFGTTTQSFTTAPVIVSNDGQLGTVPSSERFKKDIAAMDVASEAILSLKPVTFHYKTDTKSIPQFGLIAEEVAKVNPALVLPDKEGKPYTVRYDAVNAMLLNEFLKEHLAVQEQRATIAQQQKQIEALTAGLQKVSAQLEASKPAPQVVNNP
jgi:Chaperone of endosialidase